MSNPAMPTKYEFKIGKMIGNKVVHSGMDGR